MTEPRETLRHGQCKVNNNSLRHKEIIPDISFCVIVLGQRPDPLEISKCKLRFISSIHGKYLKWSSLLRTLLIPVNWQSIARRKDSYSLLHVPVLQNMATVASKFVIVVIKTFVCKLIQFNIEPDPWQRAWSRTNYFQFILSFYLLKFL